jgi:LysR family hydrogen peroxide-inducible transcriptional activator
MEFHQLRYFCAIVRTGTFTRAAESEHVAQPSLSQQILKLEDELGGKLFYRLPRKARLTPLGERFLPRALAILQGIREAQADMNNMVRLTRPQAEQQPTARPFKQPPANMTNNGQNENGNGVSPLRKSA